MAAETDILHLLGGTVAWRLCVAAAIGLLIGIERERRKNSARQTGPGLRTFTLVSLMGGLAAQTNSVLVAGVAAGFAVLLAILGDRRSKTPQGKTTQVALVITAILGILAQARPAEAIGAAVAAAALMSSRAPLHRFARDWLTEQEVRDGLLFAIAALIVLPLLPNRAIDPLKLVNPFALWRLAVVLMGVSVFSHFATRILGPRYGLVISGFAGGFVSSTATIAALGARAKTARHLARHYAAGAVASISGSLLFLAILVTAADPDILRPLIWPFLVSAILLLFYAVVLAWRAAGTRAQLPVTENAFDFRTALLFVGLVGAFSLASWALIVMVGKTAIYAGIIGTALIDAHAAAVSIATLVAGGQLNADAGAFAVLIGFSANMMAKTPTAFAMGGPFYGVRVTAGLCILVAGLWIGRLLA